MRIKNTRVHIHGFFFYRVFHIRVELIHNEFVKKTFLSYNLDRRSYIFAETLSLVYVFARPNILESHNPVPLKRFVDPR